MEDLPTFHAKMGRTKENVAPKIVDKIKRPTESRQRCI